MVDDGICYDGVYCGFDVVDLLCYLVWIGWWWFKDDCECCVCDGRLFVCLVDLCCCGNVCLMECVVCGCFDGYDGVSEFCVDNICFVGGWFLLIDVS